MMRTKKELLKHPAKDLFKGMIEVGDTTVLKYRTLEVMIDIRDLLVKLTKLYLLDKKENN